MSQRRTVTLSRFAECLGIEAALTLTAFFSHAQSLYVPGQYRRGHLIGRVVGEDGFLALIRDFGGETVSLPKAHFEPERRLGAVHCCLKSGLNTREIADRPGISWRRVRQIELAIQSGQALTAAARSA